MKLKWISAEDFSNIVDDAFGLLAVIPCKDEKPEKQILDSLEKLISKANNELQQDARYDFSLGLDGSMDSHVLPVFFMKETDYHDDPKYTGLARLIPLGYNNYVRVAGALLLGKQGVNIIKDMSWFVWNAKLSSEGDEFAKETIGMAEEELGTLDDEKV